VASPRRGPSEEARRTEKLIPNVRYLADAIAATDWDLTTAAEELWVDEATLRDRLTYMTHPAERAYWRSRFSES
jgi:hypothetical protein